MNEGIELHDSTLESVTTSGGTTVVTLSPAYVHRTDRIPGSDPGSGWIQPATLTVGVASLTATPTRFPATISDGFLRIEAQRSDNVIPASGTHHAEIELEISLSTGESLAVQGQCIHIALHGEASFVEHFNPRSEHF